MATTLGMRSHPDESEDDQDGGSREVHSSSIASESGASSEVDDETRKCCDCCKECCWERCACEACCHKCRKWFPCCKRCCLCSCRRSRDPAPPVVFSWGDGVRDLIDNNVILGCVFRFRSTPSCGARWLLMLLFLMAAVFVTYAQLATGPTCVRKYLAQCPPFETLAHHLPPERLKQAPPAIHVPEGVKFRDGPAESAGGTFEEDAGSLMPVEQGKSYPEVARDSMLEGWSYMFGSWQFNCNKPMCDIFYPQMIDWLSLWSLTNSIWGSSRSFHIPAASEAVILGYCKCEGPAYDGIVSARVTGEARSVAITLIFQTLLVAVFRTVLTKLSEAAERGARSKCLAACSRVSVALLLAAVAAMAAGVFLLEFDPAGWRKAFALSALNAAILSPLLSLGQMLICDRAGWPLRRCGLGPPAAPVSRVPMICGFGRSTTAGPESESSRL